MTIEAINQVLLTHCPELLFQWLPGGKLQGERRQEYVVRNPVRSDVRPGSFSINVENGAWADFATGDKGTNLVGLAAYVRGLRFAEAAEQLEQEFGIPQDSTTIDVNFSALINQAKKSQNTETHYIVPVPKNAPPPPIPLNATGYWAYHTADGEVIGYIYRTDPPGKRKQFIPLSYTDQGWKQIGFTTPRPLYGLRELAERPTARVLLVEGEKAADAGRVLFPDDVVVSWPNGSSNAHLVQWSPLVGRTILAIPDHDDPGRKVMAQIAVALQDIASIRVLTLPEDTPEKWDLADAIHDGWSPKDATAWLDRLCLDTHPGQAANEAVGEFQLTLPTALQQTVDWILATSARPQPVFAVQGALALASVLMGRRYRTDQNNYPSLYFVNVGPSTCGKEHVKTALEAILESAGLDALLGPSGYTSASGVLTHLQSRPTHLTIIDELGSFLRASKQASNSFKSEALTQLVECFGRLHGTVRPLGYSQQTASAKQADDGKRLSVIRPAITLLAMTTPGTLFDNLSINQVESGLINRLIIAETDRGRVASQRVQWTQPPQSVLDWARQVRFNGEGDLVQKLPDLPCDTPGNPLVFSFSSAANRLWDDFDVFLLRAMDPLDHENLAPLFGRTREKAMRLSLLLAGSDHPDHPAISAEWAEQARLYVWHKDQQTVESYRGRVAESEFGRLYNAILDCVSKGGPQGRTLREIGQYCRLFRDKKPSERAEAVQALQHDGQIIEAELPTARGKARKALIRCAVSADE